MIKDKRQTIEALRDYLGWLCGAVDHVEPTNGEKKEMLNAAIGYLEEGGFEEGMTQ